MIPHGVEIFIALQPVDLRWSFDRLAGAVTERVGRSARSGALFFFIGKRRDACKVLFFDGSGMCQFYKRLDVGAFRLPESENEGGYVEVDESTLEALLDGVTVEAKPRRKRPRGASIH